MFPVRTMIEGFNLLIFCCGAIVGVVYLLSPDLRRDLEINILNRQAWYYLGKYVERGDDDPDYAPGGWEGAADGCDKPERTFYHSAWDENAPFDDSPHSDFAGLDPVLDQRDPDRRPNGRSVRRQVLGQSDRHPGAARPMLSCAGDRGAAARPCARMRQQAPQLDRLLGQDGAHYL